MKHIRRGKCKLNNPTLDPNRVFQGFSLLKEKLTDHNEKREMGSNIQMWQVGKKGGEEGTVGLVVPKATPLLVQPLKGQ